MWYHKKFSISRNRSRGYPDDHFLQDMYCSLSPENGTQSDDTDPREVRVSMDTHKQQYPPAHLFEQSFHSSIADVISSSTSPWSSSSSPIAMVTQNVTVPIPVTPLDLSIYKSHSTCFGNLSDNLTVSMFPGNHIAKTDTFADDSISTDLQSSISICGSPSSSDSSTFQWNLLHECHWLNCERKFTCIEDLAVHVNNYHVRVGRVESDYQCNWIGCTRKGKGFNARYKMLLHIRAHTKEKPHKCSACGKSFSRLENLKIHKRTHTGEKPYVCPYEGCKKAYSNSSDKFKHARTHTEDKPYGCKMPACNKRYTDPSSLRKHVRIHGHYVKGTDSDQVRPGLSASVTPPDLDITYICRSPVALELVTRMTV